MIAFKIYFASILLCFILDWFNVKSKSKMIEFDQSLMFDFYLVPFIPVINSIKVVCGLFDLIKSESK